MNDQEKNPVAGRLAGLRELMERERLSAFIFPSTDPHQSEYVADHWKGREFVSGFNGSAGTAVVTLRSQALWTDSRYFLAAEEQLDGTGYALMRLKIEGTPSIEEWLTSELKPKEHAGRGLEVGIDGSLWSESEVRRLREALRQNGGMTLRTNLDPLKTVWKNRPPIPHDKVFLHPLAFAGEETRQKMARIRSELRRKHADGMVVARLDDIAWALNLRGSDIHCNPVFVAYLLISTDKATLYINKEKLTDEVKHYLAANNIATDDYDNIGQGLRKYGEWNILADPDEVCHALFSSIKCRIVEDESPIPAMKIMKNATEQEGYRRAMERDGVAMVRLLMWLEQQEETTEMDIDRQLTALRAGQQHFRGLSFDTICGYAEHGAIVHYEATPDTNMAVGRRGLLLLDSGGQYLDGTTDITRTICRGPLTDEERRVYTLVLKGHLQLQNMIFPDGASGTQIDMSARRDLWRNGINYLHGTGHGVGSFLSVHEGPHQVRMEWKPQPLRAGMTVTCEPGAYLPGRFGVRIENTELVVSHSETEFGRFLCFEPLTLCPIDKQPIVREMMTEEEVAWLNDYHKTVAGRLSPLLNEDERLWLEASCQPL